MTGLREESKRTCPMPLTVSLENQDWNSLSVTSRRVCWQNMPENSYISLEEFVSIANFKTSRVDLNIFPVSIRMMLNLKINVVVDFHYNK